MKLYVSKGDWFIKGTFAEMIVDCLEDGWGIFCGLRQWEGGGEPGAFNDTSIDEEGCRPT